MFLLRLDVPSLRGSSTSSSWLPSPGCVLRGSSCTSCWWRSSRANTPGKSTTMCLVTCSLPSWSASPQPSITGAMGPRKRKCSFPNKSLEMQSRHAGCYTVWAYLLCLHVAAFEKKIYSSFLLTPYVHPWRLHQNIWAPFASYGQLFNFLCHFKVADRLNTVVSEGPQLH